MRKLKRFPATAHMMILNLRLRCHAKSLRFARHAAAYLLSATTSKPAMLAKKRGATQLLVFLFFAFPAQDSQSQLGQKPRLPALSARLFSLSSARAVCPSRHLVNSRLYKAFAASAI